MTRRDIIEWPYSTPREIIAIFCALNAEVARKRVGYSHASDCFCRDPARGGLREPYDPDTFRHDGITIHFIIEATREKLARDADEATK